MRSRLSILLGLIIAIPSLPSALAADSRFGLSDKFGGSLPKAATVKKSRNSQRNQNDRDRDDRDRDRDDRDRDDRDRDSRNSRDNRPRVVGRREPVRAFGSTLSKNKDKSEKKENHAAEQMKRTETQSLGLRSYTSSNKPTKSMVPIRVTGTVGQTVIRRGDRQVNAYYLESTVGRVPISTESFGKGGVKISDLAQIVDRRVRLTGRGFFKDDARQQPRFDTISKIEYDRSQK